jgi:C-terminal processing protease CtpA/Prc
VLADAALVDSAIDWIQQNALRRDALDWIELRARAHERLKSADRYVVIEEVLKLLGDGHSALRLRWRTQDVADPTPPKRPRAIAIDSGIGLLELPAVSTHGDAALPYPHAAHDDLRELASTTRWVVDLRENEGGNLWPMLLAAGPLLGEGDAGRFIYRGAAEQRWGYRTGAVHLDDMTMLRIVDAARIAGPRAIAVLTGPRTRSSGEAMTLAFRGLPQARAFGAPTSGVPTCNRLHRLDENASIALTVGWMADRNGNTFDGPIEPDEQTDDALGSATRWLRSC